MEINTVLAEIWGKKYHDLDLMVRQLYAFVVRAIEILPDRVMEKYIRTKTFHSISVSIPSLYDQPEDIQNLKFIDSFVIFEGCSGSKVPIRIPLTKAIFDFYLSMIGCKKSILWAGFDCSDSNFGDFFIHFENGKRDETRVFQTIFNDYLVKKSKDEIYVKRTFFI